MADKFTTEDLGHLIDADPELRKAMLKTAQVEYDYWASVVRALGGTAKGRGGRKAAEDAPEVTDGKTHRQAILDVLKPFKAGATSKEIRAKLDAAGHPMKPTILHSTLAYLMEQDEVAKKKAPKGKRGNTYRVK